jgi:hypothetical protein
MRNVNNTHALRAETFQFAKKHFCLRRRQRGGWLIENEDAGIAKKRTRDLHQLPQRHGQRLHAGPDIAQLMEANCLHSRGAFTLHRSLIDEAEASRLATKKKILSHAEVRSERELLMNNANAQPGRVRGRSDARRGALHQNVTRVRYMDAAERFDERGFARAVLAEQRMDFTRTQVEAHAAQRPHAAEGFLDFTQLQQAQ